MKNTIRILFGVLIGTIIGTIVFGDNLKRSIKVATMQVDTVYCTSLSKVEIDIDTIRTYRKDKLIIVTGVNKLTANYNVKKSEWIDRVLLTKPNEAYLDDYDCSFNVCTGMIYIKYDDFYIYRYAWCNDENIYNYQGKPIMVNGVYKKHKVSPQTLKNIKTIMDRYQYILTH